MHNLGGGPKVPCSCDRDIPTYSPQLLNHQIKSNALIFLKPIEFAPEIRNIIRTSIIFINYNIDYVK